MTNIAMENPPIFKFGKPSISKIGPSKNHGELLKIHLKSIKIHPFLIGKPSKSI